MLLPLVGFVIFAAFFSGIGSFVLRWCLPSVGWSFLNLILFLVGAWLASGTALLVTGAINGRSSFAYAAVAGILGGVTAVALRGPGPKR
ncbi:MAG: hypothetical protein ABSB35_38930 [Bryobacteraceae bacterium]